MNTLKITNWTEEPEIQSLSKEIKLYLSLGGKIEWGKVYFLKLKYLPHLEKYICILLLRTDKITDPFRHSLKKQLVEWLDTNNPHPTPFSKKQWTSLINSFITLEYKNSDS